MSERLCLIVDDERGIRTYLRAILESRGMETLEADSAAEALQLLRTHGDRINLIITDVQINGDMNGVDLAFLVRKSNPTLPVVLISGTGEKAPAGFPFVIKPFRPAAIFEAIDSTTRPLRAAS